MRFSRNSGILVHITSLPSPYGIGDMGPDAYKFIDILNENDQSIWQILPFGVADKNGCPYSGLSAFGGYSLLISPDKLIDYGLLGTDDFKEMPKFSNDQVDFSKVGSEKNKLC